MRIKQFIISILVLLINPIHAKTPAPAGFSDVEFWSTRLNTSVIYQFTYNDAISDGTVTDEEYDNLARIYLEESKKAEITLDAYKQVLALKKEFNNYELDKVISGFSMDGKLTHYEVDEIIKKYMELIK